MPGPSLGTLPLLRGCLALEQSVRGRLPARPAAPHLHLGTGSHAPRSASACPTHRCSLPQSPAALPDGPGFPLLNLCPSSSPAPAATGAAEPAVDHAARGDIRAPAAKCV